MADLEGISNEIEKVEVVELKQHINDLDEAFNGSDNVRKATLPEKVLKDFFIPGFLDTDNKDNVAVMKFIEYAGSPYSEVDIINERGEVIFTCPPMMNNSKSDTGKNIPYSELAGTYELKKARMIQEADQYMSGVAGGIASTVEIAKDNSTFTWNKIIEKYTVPNKIDEDIGVSNDLDDDMDDDFINYD